MLFDRGEEGGRVDESDYWLFWRKVVCQTSIDFFLNRFEIIKVTVERQHISQLMPSSCSYSQSVTAAGYNNDDDDDDDDDEIK